MAKTRSDNQFPSDDAGPSGSGPAGGRPSREQSGAGRPANFSDKPPRDAGTHGVNVPIRFGMRIRSVMIQSSNLVDFGFENPLDSVTSNAGIHPLGWTLPEWVPPYAVGNPVYDGPSFGTPGEASFNHGSEPCDGVSGENQTSGATGSAQYKPDSPFWTPTVDEGEPTGDDTSSTDGTNGEGDLPTMPWWYGDGGYVIGGLMFQTKDEAQQVKDAFTDFYEPITTANGGGYVSDQPPDDPGTTTDPAGPADPVDPADPVTGEVTVVGTHDAITDPGADLPSNIDNIVVDGRDDSILDIDNIQIGWIIVDENGDTILDATEDNPLEVESKPDSDPKYAPLSDNTKKMLLAAVDAANQLLDELGPIIGMTGAEGLEMGLGGAKDTYDAPPPPWDVNLADTNNDGVVDHGFENYVGDDGGNGNNGTDATDPGAGSDTGNGDSSGGLYGPGAAGAAAGGAAGGGGRGGGGGGQGPKWNWPDGKPPGPRTVDPTIKQLFDADRAATGPKPVMTQARSDQIANMNRNFDRIQAEVDEQYGRDNPYAASEAESEAVADAEATGLAEAAGEGIFGGLTGAQLLAVICGAIAVGLMALAAIMAAISELLSYLAAQMAENDPPRPDRERGALEGLEYYPGYAILIETRNIRQSEFAMVPGYDDYNLFMDSRDGVTEQCYVAVDAMERYHGSCDDDVGTRDMLRCHAENENEKLRIMMNLHLSLVAQKAYDAGLR